jgi:hypothetical protein
MLEIENLLKINGFILDKEVISNTFGDYFKIFVFKDMEIRLINSKNQLSFDIRKKNFEWFDLAILKSMISNDVDLTQKFDSNDFQYLIYLNIETVKKLFNDLNYKKTENQLKKLEKVRVKQIFKNLN